MNLKELYLNHTRYSNICPICNSYLSPLTKDITKDITCIPCHCGFIKFHTGFNLELNSREVYCFNFIHEKFSFPIDNFHTYLDVLHHIHKLQIFK